MPKEKICDECGAEFVPEHTDSKVCRTCKEIDDNRYRVTSTPFD